VFAVQIAAVGTAAAADEIMRSVRATGYEPRVVRDGGLFKVRAGRFRTRAEAERAQADLRQKLGGTPFIVEESP
jgi:N-acetylmuramoyl-L-alanine amidase